MSADADCIRPDELGALVAGSLSADETTRLERHLESCAACQHALAELIDSDDAVARVADHLRATVADLTPSLARAAERASRDAGGRDPSEREWFAADDASRAIEYLDPPDRPDLLGRLGRYEISEVVGHGGMGVVFKAHDPKLNRVVAIKVLAPALAGYATARRRFLREAQAAAAITHQNVVTIHAVEEDRLPYLVMEYVDGQSLETKIERQGPLCVKEILRIGTQVAAGLAAAHAHGLIHRDIKPANILLENGVERVRITDFGLARADDDVNLTKTGDVPGTPQYMSPEQAQGHAVDARSDLFSLGSVLYAMCTGRSPFRAETTLAALRRVCDDTPRPIREINPEIPGSLTQIIDRLLAKNPDGRFQSASEVADVLGRHLAHVQDPASTRLPETRRRFRPGSRRRWLLAGGLLLVAAAALGVMEATGVTRVLPTLRIAREGTLEPKRAAPAANGARASPFSSVDLLRLIDVQRDAVDGNWRFEAETLVSPATGRWNRIDIPHDTPEEYDLDLTAERKSGTDMLSLALISGQREFFVSLDMFEGRLSGLGLIDGKDAFANETTRERPIFRDGRPHKIVCRVRRSGVSVSLDGEPLIEWRGSLERLSRPRAGETGRLGLCVTHSSYHIYDLVLRPVKPMDRAGRPVPPGGSPSIRVGPMDAATRPATGAFVLLADDPDRERSFNTLSAAIAGSSAGDAIEVRGDGPFLTPPVDIPRALAIRAAAGFRPVLRLNSGSGGAECLLMARAPLVLEGLQLEQMAPESGRLRLLDSSRDASLYVANCRFVKHQPGGYAIAGEAVPVVVRNCEFLMRDGSSLAFTCRVNGRWEIENCIHVGTIGFHHPSASASEIDPPDAIRPAFIRLSRNTIVAESGLELDRFNGSDVSDGDKRRPSIRLEASENLFDTRSAVLRASFRTTDGRAGAQPAAAAAPEATKLPMRLVDWIGQQNVYPVRGNLLVLEFSNGLERSEAILAKDLPGWNNAWGLTETGSLQDEVRFQAEYENGQFNPVPLAAEFDQLQPEHFRLHRDSAGYRAGPHGEDLGAQVDHIGPGAAYERWKQTPEYFDWLKDTAPAPPPGVLDALDPDRIPTEQRFDWQPAELVQVLGACAGRHWHAPTCVVCSPDGTLAASAGYDGYIYLWDAETLQLRKMLDGHGVWLCVWGLAFLPDGQRLLSAGEDNLIRVWDVESGREVRHFTGHTGHVTDVAVSHDGRWALSAGRDGSMRLWDVETAEQLHVFEGHMGGITSVAFSPDGRRALSGGNDSTMRLWDLERKQELRGFQGHTGHCRRVGFLPDGQGAISCGHDGTLRLWDLNTAEEIRCLRGHTDEIYGLDVSSDGLRAISTGNDRTIRVWNLQTGRESFALRSPTPLGFSSVAFSADGRRAVTGGHDQTIRLWDLDSQMEIHGDPQTPFVEGRVWRIRFSHDGRRMLTCMGNNFARLWDVESGRDLQTFEQAGRIRCMAFTTDGRHALGGGEAGVGVWSVATGRELRRFEAARNVWDIAVSRDGRTVLTGDHHGEHGALRLWQFETGQELQAYRGHAGAVHSVALSADGRRALSGGWDRIVRLWDLDSGNVVGQWQHSNPVWSVTFSADDRFAASGDEDGFIRLWDISGSAPALRRLPRAHQGLARALSFSPDSRTFASVGDHQVIIWDVASGEPRHRWQLPSSVMGTSFAPDGRHLATANANGTVYILRLADPDQPDRE